MITGELRSTIDKLWLDFYSGGITNPLTVIEQISFLMFSRLLDIRESREEKRAARTGKSSDLLFAANKQHLRWSQFRQKPPEEMLTVFQRGSSPKDPWISRWKYSPLRPAVWPFTVTAL